MVDNFKCIDCDKSSVCKWFDTLKKFSDEYVKNSIKVHIEMKDCPEYKEV